MLHAYEWNAQEIINKYKENANEVLVYSRVKPRVPLLQASSSRTSCVVCANTPPIHKFSALACCHYFCNDCWAMHFEVQIMQGKFPKVYLRCFLSLCRLWSIGSLIYVFYN
jgi:ariadne-2